MWQGLATKGPKALPAMAERPSGWAATRRRALGRWQTWVMGPSQADLSSAGRA